MSKPGFGYAQLIKGLFVIRFKPGSLPVVTHSFFILMKKTMGLAQVKEGVGILRIRLDPFLIELYCFLVRLVSLRLSFHRRTCHSQPSMRSRVVGILSDCLFQNFCCSLILIVL